MSQEEPERARKKMLWELVIAGCVRFRSQRAARSWGGAETSHLLVCVNVEI